MLRVTRYRSSTIIIFIGVKPDFITHNPHVVGYKIDHGVPTTRHVGPDLRNEKTWLVYRLHISQPYFHK